MKSRVLLGKNDFQIKMTQKYDCKTLLRAQKDVRVCLADTCNWAIWFLIILMIFWGDSSVGKESTCNSGDPHFYFLVGKICWRRDRPPTPVFLGFPCGSADKESAYNAGDFGSIPGLGRSLREGNTTVFWPPEFWTGCKVHGIAKSWSQPSEFNFHLLRTKF